MAVLAQLDREDERRRFLDVLVAKRKPDSPADRRDMPLQAHCQCECRRRWLMERLSVEELVLYMQRLDDRGEKLTWDHLKEKTAAAATVPKPLEAGAAEAPKAVAAASNPSEAAAAPAEAAEVSKPKKSAKKSARRPKPQEVANETPSPLAEVAGAAEVAEAIEPAKLPGEDKHVGDSNGAEMEEEKSLDVITEETDDTLRAFKESLSKKKPSETWVAKFAKDADAEVGMSVHDRMDRDGVRFLHAELQLNDCAMTEEEEQDLERARQGAHSRRWRLLSQMTKAEQRAYKPRRT